MPLPAGYESIGPGRKKQKRECVCGCGQWFKPQDFPNRPPQRYATRDCYTLHRKSLTGKFFPQSFYAQRKQWERDRLERSLGKLVDAAIAEGKITRGKMLDLARKAYLQGRHATRQQHAKFRKAQKQAKQERTRCA
jgi:hypothetical protein